MYTEHWPNNTVCLCLSYFVVYQEDIQLISLQEKLLCLCRNVSRAGQREVVDRLRTQISSKEDFY